MDDNALQLRISDLLNMEDDRFAAALAKIVRKYRNIRSISRDGLAYQLNLHKNTLYGVEIGIKRKSGHFSHTQLTMVNFVKMAAFFGKQPGELLQEVLLEVQKIVDDPKDLSNIPPLAAEPTTPYSAF